MTASRLRNEVFRANLDLFSSGLVTGTFGNVSGVDRKRGLVAIKPSGVPYDRLRSESIVIVSLDDGRVVHGRLRPSSDLPTHLELYRAFANIGGIVHTHSMCATAWAQARKPIPALGTTHADYFNGPVPCTRPLRANEIRDDYEINTGRVIVERFARLDPAAVPGVLVACHGPFAWGGSADEAVDNAIAMENVAVLASQTLAVNPACRGVPAALLNKHYTRKHGRNAYYGQTK